MDRPIAPSFVQGSGKVSRIKNFGSTHSLFSVSGNILYSPGKTFMVFKGARSITAMHSFLRRATEGELVLIRVSMMVATIQLQQSFSIREHGSLEVAIMRKCGREAVVIMPRTEEESNALMFRVKRWAVFLPGEPALAASMDSLSCIISITRTGNTTMRTSSDVRGDVPTWLDTQKGVQRSLNQFAHFILELGVGK